MTVQEIDYTIKVFCDDPSHARGKVAKIETFYREAEADPTGQRWWFTLGESAVLSEDMSEQLSGGGRTGEATYQKRDQSDWPRSLESVHRRYDEPDLGRQNRPKYRCNLCGQGLPANAGTLNRALDRVAAQGEWRIADGVSRIRLTLLEHVASSLPS
jgi:hypothetical protein